MTGLLIIGCQTVQRNLETFPPPMKPELKIESNNEKLCMNTTDFSLLTAYAIKLEGQLQKCNAQAELFN